jgi:hypothetical protein
MSKVLKISMIILLTLWGIVTIFISVALISKVLNPGLKSISALDLKYFLKFSITVVFFLVMLSFARRYLRK